MVKHGYKERLNITVTKLTAQILEEMRKNSKYSYGVIIDNLVNTHARDKEFMLIEKKRVLAKQMCEVDEQLDKIRDKKNYEKELSQIAYINGEEAK